MGKEAVEEVQKLGLNSYEAKIYLALLERDTLSVSEIAQISRVPRVRTYDILESLVSRGLASLRPGKYMRYRAVDFDTLKNRFINQIDKRYSEEKSNIEKVTLNLKKQLEPTLLKRNNLENNPLDYIEIIKDPYQMHSKFIELVSKAESEILIFTKPPYAGPKKILDEQTKSQAEPLRRGIKIESIYEIPESDEELTWWYDDIAVAAGHGEESRVIANLPMKMAVFDERIVMLPLKDPVSSDTSFTTQVVSHASLAKGLRILFNTLWDKAEDYRILEEKVNRLRGEN